MTLRNDAKVSQYAVCIRPIQDYHARPSLVQKARRVFQLHTDKTTARHERVGHDMRDDAQDDCGSWLNPLSARIQSIYSISCRFDPSRRITSKQPLSSGSLHNLRNHHHSCLRTLLNSSMSSSPPPCPMDRSGCCSSCLAAPCSHLRTCRCLAYSPSALALVPLEEERGDCVRVGVGGLLDLALALALWLGGLTALFWCGHVCGGLEELSC